MWVFCCGMNRSGSTLQYQLAVALVELTGTGRGLGFVTPRQFNEAYRGFETSGKMWVVKCHDFFDTARSLLAENSARALCVHRDIRDVAVSYMNFRRVSFWSMLARGFLENAIRNDRLWRAADNRYESRYEVMQADLASEVKRMAAFLNVAVNDQTVARIVAEHGLERNKQRLEKDAGQQAAGPRGSAGYDPRTLMHRNHISSGDVGQWKHALSDFQVAAVEHIAGAWMRASGYGFSQPADLRQRAGWLTYPYRTAAGATVPGVRKLWAATRGLAAPDRNPLTEALAGPPATAQRDRAA